MLSAQGLKPEGSLCQCLTPSWPQNVRTESVHALTKKRMNARVHKCMEEGRKESRQAQALATHSWDSWPTSDSATALLAPGLITESPKRSISLKEGWLSQCKKKRRGKEEGTKGMGRIWSRWTRSRG